jgi:ABC-type Na+ efflux pump permease subunit
MEDPSVVNAEYWLSWMPIVLRVATALIAIGVVMEFAESWVSEPWRKIVDDARSRQIAQLSSDLEASRAEVAGANARVAEATQKAAEATLELAKFKAPRTLTSNSKSRLGCGSIRFSGSGAVPGES